MADETIFDKILRGEIPSEEVLSDEEFYAFRDINAQAPTHVLVIPRKQIPRIIDATEEDAALLGRLVLFANKVAVKEGIAEDGFRYVINCNVHGGQTVYHLHLHVIGGRQLTWPPG